MKVHFYLPAQYHPSPEVARQWQDGTLREIPAGGRIACSQGWIYQTWAQLNGRADVELTDHLPETGVIVAMSNSLHTNFRANDSQFVVAVAADYEPHPGAQLQILQNPAAKLTHSVFMPHWPMPGLIPRDPARGDRFENLAFFGAPENLAPGIAETKWPGIELRIPPSSQWQDFSEVDGVIGIRDFTTATHARKPATKLYNAWLAGAIFLGGRDAALRGERRSELDYLEAHSLAELTAVIERLQKDPELRRAMMANALKRAEEVSPAATRARWLDFITTKLPQHVADWNQRSSLSCRWFWEAQRLNLAIRKRLPESFAM